MDVHVATHCCSGYYQLWQLHPMTRSLSPATTEAVVHALIANRSDYCNSLLYGMADALMYCLQSVQNAAVWLVTGVQCQPCDNSTGCPCGSTYCLRLLSSFSNCLTGLAPSYLAEDCQFVSDFRPCRLRSPVSSMCVVRHAHNTYSDQCFSAAGLQVWNSLPAEPRQCNSLGQF